MDFSHKDSKEQLKIIGENNFTYINTLKFVNKYFIKKKGETQRALDIGSGVGTVSFYLAKRCFSITGVEISENAVNLAKKAAKKLKIQRKTKFIRGDIQKINLRKNYFDYVICNEVLEHLSKDQLVLDKIFLTLKKKGKLIISVPSQNAPLHKLGIVRKFDRRVGHLRRYPVEKLARKIKKAGLSVIEIKKTEGILRNLLFISNIFRTTIRFIKGPLVDIFSFVDNLLLRMFGESNIYLVAQKP